MGRDRLVSFTGSCMPPPISQQDFKSKPTPIIGGVPEMMLKDVDGYLLSRILKRHHQMLPPLLLTKPIVKVNVARALCRESTFLQLSRIITLSWLKMTWSVRAAPLCSL